MKLWRVLGKHLQRPLSVRPQCFEDKTKVDTFIKECDTGLRAMYQKFKTYTLTKHYTVKQTLRLALGKIVSESELEGEVESGEFFLPLIAL